MHQSSLPMQYQPSFDYTQAYRQSQLGTHAGQTAADPTHGNALLQVSGSPYAVFNEQCLVPFERNSFVDTRANSAPSVTVKAAQ